MPTCAREIVSYRVAGAAAPRHVLRALKASYPHVKLAWNTRLKRWVMIQRLITGAYEPFRILGDRHHYEAPTMQNTIAFLGYLESRMRNRNGRRQLLAEMDATDPSLKVKAQAQERVREGSREMEKFVLRPTLRLRVNGLQAQRKRSR